MAVVGELLVLIGANNTALTAGLAKSEAELKGFGASGTSALAGIRMAALGVGVASVAGMGLAVSAASSFQEQMAIINTIAHQTPAELDKSGESIRAMAVATGPPLSDMTKAFYDLLSAGISASKAVDVLRLSTTLSIGSLSTVDQAVDLLTTAINAYHLSAKQATVATDQFALAVQDGKVTADQIAATFADVAPLAKTAGIGIDEIAATYAVLTARGVPAAEAMTQMNRVMVELLKPNADLRDLQDKLGISFAKVAADKGLVVALQQMRVAAAANGVPFQDLFGRLEGMKFALSTTGPFFKTYEQELVNMHHATGTAAEQAEERMGTFDRQLAILGQSVNDLGIAIGTALLPPLTSFVESVSGAVQSVSAWAEANPQVASTILPVTAAIAGLVIVATSLGAIFGIVGTAIGILTSPIVVIGAAVTALAAYFGLLGTDAKAAIDGIIASITGLIPTTGPVRTALDLLGQAADGVRVAIAFVSQAVGVVVGWFRTFVTYLTGGQNGAKNTAAALSSVGTVLSQVGTVIVTVATNLLNFTARVIDAANKAGVFKAAGDLINAMFAILGVSIRGALDLFGRIAGVLGTVAGPAFNAIATTIGTVVGKIAELIQGIKDAIAWLGTLNRQVTSQQSIDYHLTGKVPGMATGGFVPPRPGGTIVRVAEGGQGEFIGTGSQLAGLVGGGRGGSTSGGGSVTHVTHMHLHIDGREIAEIIDERLFRAASGFSSGFTAGNPVTGA
jgi:TP901 family phage tail tape measure protein